MEYVCNTCIVGSLRLNSRSTSEIGRDTRNKVPHVLMHVIIIGDMGLPAWPGQGVSNVKELPWNIPNFDIVLLQT